MAKIRIACPSCRKKGNFEVLESNFKNNLRGILTINVSENTICPHSFLVYIDKNLQIRDYFIADFKLELPEVSPIQIKQDLEILEEELIDVNIIKTNLHAYLLTFVLRAIFFKEKIVFVNDYEYLNKQIFNFFKYIAQNSFELNISFISKKDYQELEKKDEKAFYFDLEALMNEFQNLKSAKQLKLESRIVQKFFVEEGFKPSLIILKNDLKKVYDISVMIRDYINIHKEKDKIYSKNILEHLESVHNIKISIQYLSFLIDIIKKYFNVSVQIYLPNVSGIW